MSPAGLSPVHSVEQPNPLAYRVLRHTFFSGVGRGKATKSSGDTVVRDTHMPTSSMAA
jgi:hypothetical protein